MSLNIKIRFRSITISDGSSIELNEDDALIMVGPNNAGKSQFLRDLEMLSGRTRHSREVGKTVKDIEFIAPDKKDILESLEKFRPIGSDYYLINGYRCHINSVKSNLNPNFDGLHFGETSNFFVKRVSADDRLSIVSPSQSLGDNGPMTPGQILYDNEILLDRVSSIFFKAFRKDIFLDYRAGASIPLYIGEKPKIPSGCDRVSNEYVSLVRECDKLHEQGDGMRSFGGIILSTLVSKFNITLIDEPEAFLHPPQERIIGKVIGQETTGQVICSTHSTNVLQGFLESGRQNIRVLRITRDSKYNKIREISSSEISKLWKDPVFRYSNALDALFHDRAVLCEAEPDCRFYEAVEKHLFSDEALDSHYIPCAGKAAFPKFSNALRKLGVPVIAILDLDALNDERTIKAIYEAQGGNWNNISEIWKRLDTVVRNGMKVLTTDDIKAKIDVLLDGWCDGPAPLSQIIETLNQRKPWGVIKDFGLNALPSGDAQNIASSLIEALSKQSVFLVPVGTMERFVPTVGNHGNKWLSAVFEQYDLTEPALGDARKFISAALSSESGS